MDLHGSVMFLRGKLKEFTDLVGGPDAIVAKQQDRHEVQEMAQTLSSLLAGQDEMTRRIEQGLSLHDASRHRPDLSMGDPMGGLKRFTDVKLAALMFYFGKEGMDMVVQRWCESPVESFLSSVVIELLHYLERFTSRAKECQTLVNIITTFTKTVDKVASLAHRPCALQRYDTSPSTHRPKHIALNTSPSCVASRRSLFPPPEAGRDAELEGCRSEASHVGGT